ncbi:MAG TPA: hypothetical protein VM425_21155 [Myxococcota bacterium]|nr:hypothetical protein [Myxococcota bacterium]
MESINRNRNVDNVQKDVVRDRYLSHDSHRDAQLIHMYEKYASRIDLGAWARESRDLSFIMLRKNVHDELGCSMKEAHEIAQHLEENIGYAVYRAADMKIRPVVAGALRNAAERLDGIANDKQACTALLDKLEAGLSSDLRDETAKLQAYGLTREQAAGMAVQLKNFGSKSSMQKMLSAHGCAMYKGDSMHLADFQAALRRSAGELRALAADLPHNRSVPVFEQFPALTKGLRAGIDKHSFLAYVLDNHEKMYALEKSEMQNLGRIRSGRHGDKWVKRCMLDLGTAIGAKLAMAPGIGTAMTAIGTAGSLKSLMDADQLSRRPDELSYLARGVSEQRFLEKSHQADSELGQKIVTSILYDSAMSLAGSAI